jgi:hypothetical protein
MSDEAAVTTSAAGSEGTEAAAATTDPTVDFSPLNDRLDQMQGEFSTSLQDLAARIPAQEPAPQPGFDDFPFFGGDDGYDDDGIQEIDAEQLQSAIAQAAQQQAQQIVGPLQEQVQNLLLTQEAEKVEAQYPELKESSVAEAAAQEALRSGIPQDQLTPGVLRQAHEALKFRELQSQINPAGQGGSDGLESPGGVTPGAPDGAAAQQEIVQGIVGAGKRTLGF